MTPTPRAPFRALALALTAAALPAFGAPALAGPGKDDHARHMAAMRCHHGAAGRLSVSGQGEARIAPDMATVQLGVTTQAATAAEAMRQNATQQGAVIAALKEAGIAEKDIQTSGLNLNPMMDYGENRAPQVTGYQASNMVAVRVVAIGDLGKVLDAIVSAGANEINGISFGRQDGADAEDEARRAAVADARHKAEVLAEAAGLSLGRLLSLQDGAAPDLPQPMMRMAADAAPVPEAVPVQAGELAMGATVQMVYALRGGADACGAGMPEGAPDGAPSGDAAPDDGGAGETAPAAPSN